MLPFFRLRHVLRFSSKIASNVQCRKFANDVEKHVSFNRTQHYKNLLPGYKDGGFTSKFHPGKLNDIAEEQISESLSKMSVQTPINWTRVKEEFMLDYDLLTEENFNGILLNCLLRADSLELAHSFMNFLESTERPNHLIYLKYMSLCSRHVEMCGPELITRTFNKVKSNLDSLLVLDRKRAECIIEGLCATDQWKLAFEYLKKVQESPSLLMKNCLASASIKNGDVFMAWEILTKWFFKEEWPSNRVLGDFVRHAVDLHRLDPRKAESFMVKILKYMQEKEIVVNVEVVKLIEEYFKSHSSKWKIAHAKISRTGECSTCRNSLKLSYMSNEEFSSLRNSFLDRSIKKNDLFINTTKTEFSRYISYVDNHRPFHVILDGLNAAYTFQGAKSKKNIALQLMRIVKKLSRRSRKILIIGKDCMKGWPIPIMKTITQQADIFMTSNTSEDDPFMVYAALVSGPQSCIVSMDLMRDHVARLDDVKYIRLFKKWQLSHQIWINVDETNYISFVDPLKHSINTQGDMERGWHIPYDDRMILDAYEELNNWLCIQNTQY